MSIAPFNLLPTETIALIISFSVYLNDYESLVLDQTRALGPPSPYSALAVSKRWNDLVLNTPELWTSITIPWYMRPSSLRRLLERHHRLSKALPLHVHLNPRTCHAPLLEVIRAHIRQPSVHWAAIQVVAPSPDGWRALNLPRQKAWEDMFENSPQPALEDLELVDGLQLREWRASINFDHRDQLLWIFAPFPSLRRFCLRHISCERPWEAPSYQLPPPPLCLPSLTVLCMDGVRPQSISFLLTTELPALQALGIRIISVQGFQPLSIPLEVQFPSLTAVVLYDVPDDSAVSLLAAAPGLQSLAISSPDYWGPLYLLQRPTHAKSITLPSWDSIFELQDALLEFEEVVLSDAIEAECTTDPDLEAILGCLRENTRVIFVAEDELSFCATFSRMSGWALRRLPKLQYVEPEMQ